MLADDGTIALVSLDLSSFDTSKITDKSGMLLIHKTHISY
jgi:surface protein